jgi:cation:H+ antiporter
MLPYLLLTLGIILLMKGADWLIEGSVSIAKKLGISSLIIGLTVVAFGTSMPEFVLTLFSSLEGSENIALGNIIGSNLANILLVLGLAAVIFPIKFRKNAIKLDLPFSLISALILLVTVISFIETSKIIGIFFILIFFSYVYYRIKSSKKTVFIATEKIQKDWKIALLLIVGSFSLYFGGKLTVEGIIFISQKLGLSEFLISATAIALGTSLPELITSIKAALKKHPDIAVGNIIGSNIFNILWVLGLASLIVPIKLPSLIKVDLILLVISTLILFGFLFLGKKNKLERREGIVLLLLYLHYILLVIFRG